ncbi:hypothetical protein C8R43DRAFT_1189320 [Mycena crocata]|nr:hypothetical protein C8R43DRAFT_1189320 [Mycena crocata]
MSRKLLKKADRRPGRSSKAKPVQVLLQSICACLFLFVFYSRLQLVTHYNFWAMTPSIDATYGVWLVSLVLVWMYFSASPTDPASIKWTVIGRIRNDFDAQNSENSRVTTTDEEGKSERQLDEAARAYAAPIRFVRSRTLDRTQQRLPSNPFFAGITKRLFDNVIILYSGRYIYFGPTERALEFWTSRGFVCAPRQTTGDFTTQPRRADHSGKMGHRSRVHAVWKESNECKQYKALLRNISEDNAEHPPRRLKSWTNGMSRGGCRSPSTRAPRRRTRFPWQRLRGDMTSFWLCVFYNLSADTSSFYRRSTLFFYSVLVNTFASALEIQTLCDQRFIVESIILTRFITREPSVFLFAKANMCPLRFSEAVSSMICDLPSKFITATELVDNITLHLMTKSRREADAFFIFYLLAVTTALVMSMRSDETRSWP